MRIWAWTILLEIYEQMKRNYTKGEVVNVNLGIPPIEIKGHEQGMERPCVVIKSFNNLELAFVVPLTTKEAKYSLFTIVKIQKAQQDLLPIVTHCAIKSEQFRLTGLQAYEPN